MHSCDTCAQWLETGEYIYREREGSAKWHNSLGICKLEMLKTLGTECNPVDVATWIVESEYLGVGDTDCIGWEPKEDEDE